MGMRMGMGIGMGMGMEFKSCVLRSWIPKTPSRQIKSTKFKFLLLPWGGRKDSKDAKDAPAVPTSQHICICIFRAVAAKNLCVCASGTCTINVIGHIWSASVPGGFLGFTSSVSRETEPP